MWVALSISIATLVLIMVRPKPLNEGTAAAIVGFLMLVSGRVSVRELPALLQDVGPILLFFLGLMLICLAAEKAGFFQWSAYQSVKLARGNGRLLFLTIFAFGIGLTAFFSNDATALLLTPIVFALVSQLKLDPIPYVFTCAFIANTASLILPVSNPVNLLPFTAFNLTLGEYLRHLILPSVVAIAINIVVFYFLFRRRISADFVAANLISPPKDALFKYASIVLGIIAVAYVLTSFYGLPLYWAALGGALLLVGGGLAFRRLHFHEIQSGISWPILLFIFSLSVVIQGLENSGIIAALGNISVHSFPQGSPEAITTVSLANALGSNFINNWSMMMVSVSSLGATGSAPDHSLIYAAILGADLGPNLTIVGSLSSILWLAILRQRGLEISPRHYFKVGLVLTPLLLAASIGTLYAMSRISGW